MFKEDKLRAGNIISIRDINMADASINVFTIKEIMEDWIIINEKPELLMVQNSFKPCQISHAVLSKFGFNQEEKNANKFNKTILSVDGIILIYIDITNGIPILTIYNRGKEVVEYPTSMHELQNYFSDNYYVNILL